MNKIDKHLTLNSRSGVNLGLKRIKLLLKNLGDPHQQYPVIHVAGTNGKGSVCAYLSSILLASGYRVGRYISPHLVDWTERITINHQPINEPDLLDIFEAAIDKIEEPAPTEFELLTTAAFLYFAKQKVDIAIIEVGLGGRLDATNVFDHPLITIITSISYDHSEILGPTLADIAREKAGILKPKVPALIGVVPPEAEQMIKNKITEIGAIGNWIQPSQSIDQNWAQYQGTHYPLVLPGQFQLMNSALAIAAIKILQQQQWNITPDHIIQGMTQVKWPGRIQWVKWNNRDLLLDGAHNEGGAIELRKYIETFNQPITWIIGMKANKDHRTILHQLLRPSDRLLLVPVSSTSKSDPEKLAIIAQEVCPELTEITTYPNLLEALNHTSTIKDSLLVLCGSFYLIGEFLKQI